MKMKNILAGLACLSLSCTVFAANAPKPASAFNGFYAGISAGVAQNANEVKWVSSDIYDTPFSADTIENQTNADMDSYQGIADVHAGYGHSIWRYLYLGAQVGGTFFSSNTKAKSSAQVSDPLDEQYSAKIQTNVSARLNSAEFNADLHPGVLLAAHTLLYGIVGIGINKAKVTTATTATVNDLLTGLSTTSELNQSKEKTLDGLRLGLGIKEKITKHLILGVHYVYTRYGDIKAASSGLSTDPFGGVFAQGLRNNTKVTLVRQSLMLEADYQFA